MIKRIVILIALALLTCCVFFSLQPTAPYETLNEINTQVANVGTVAGPAALNVIAPVQTTPQPGQPTTPPAATHEVFADLVKTVFANVPTVSVPTAAPAGNLAWQPPDLVATAQAKDREAAQVWQRANDQRTAQASTQLAYSAQMTQTPVAATQAANTTGTAIAVQILEWTATADSVNATSTANAAATATADLRTSVAKTETADHEIKTATAEVQRTLTYHDTTLLEQDIEQNQMTKALAALRPYVIDAALLIVLVALVIIFAPILAAQLRHVRPDKAGRLPVMVDRFGNAYTPTRNPGPLARLNQPRAELLTPVSETQQLEATRLDQLADIASRGYAANQPRPAASGIRDLVNRLLHRDPQPAQAPQRYRLYTPQEVPPDITANPVLEEVLNGEWSEAK